MIRFLSTLHSAPPFTPRSPTTWGSLQFLKLGGCSHFSSLSASKVYNTELMAPFLRSHPLCLTANHFIIRSNLGADPFEKPCKCSHQSTEYLLIGLPIELLITTTRSNLSWRCRAWLCNFVFPKFSLMSKNKAELQKVECLKQWENKQKENKGKEEMK
jgi:hypothetical protein